MRSGKPRLSKTRHISQPYCPLLVASAEHFAWIAPAFHFGVVDVRDVADLHLRAMTDPAAKGQHFLAVSGDFMSFLEIARVLKARMGAAGKRIPLHGVPKFTLRLAALADPAVRQILPELGTHKNATGVKARHLLGWQPRSREEALVATAERRIAAGRASKRCRPTTPLPAAISSAKSCPCSRTRRSD